MNSGRNKEYIELIGTLDGCGYEVVEIAPQYQRHVEGIGNLWPTKRLLLRIEPIENKDETA